MASAIPADAVSFFASLAGTGDYAYSAPRQSFYTPAQAVTAGSLADGQLVPYVAQDDPYAPIQREWGIGTYANSTVTIARTTIQGGISSGVVSGSGVRVNFTKPPVVFIGPITTNVITGTVVPGTSSIVVGGTAASSTLTLQSTSGTGTSDAIIFQVASQSEAARFNTSRQMVFSTGFGGFTPSSNANGQIVLAGAFGGGLVFTDTGFIGLWSTNSGAQLNFGVGGTSGGIPTTATLTSSLLTVPTAIAGGTAVGSSLTLESTTAAGTTDFIAFKTGSQVTRWTIDTTGQFIGNAAAIIAGGTTASSTLTLESTTGAGTTDAIIFKTASQSERWRMQTAGYLTANGFAQTDITGTSHSFLQIASTVSSNFAQSQITCSADAAIMGWASAKTRGATPSTQTILVSGDNCAAVVGYGSDGAAYQIVAQIGYLVDGTPSANVMPGRITFQVNTGGTTASEAMRIDSAKNVGIGQTAGSGIRLDVQGVTRIQTSAAGTATSLFLDRNTASIATPTSYGSLDGARIFMFQDSTSFLRTMDFVVNGQSGGQGGIMRFFTGGNTASTMTLELDINNSVIANKGPFQCLNTIGTGSLNSTLDVSPQTALTVANGANSGVGTNGQLLVLINDSNFHSAAYLCGNSSATMIGNNGADFVASTTTPAASHSSVAFNGSNGYNVYNNQGSSQTYHVMVLRLS